MTRLIRSFGGSETGKRSWFGAVVRGAGRRCPQCGRGKLFASYISPLPACSNCGLNFTGHRADDAPPYLTILIVGHLSIPLALAAKQLFDPPLWAQFAFWGPLILLASFLLLPATKGAMIGLQWANRMHGFAGRTDESAAKA